MRAIRARRARRRFVRSFGRARAAARTYGAAPACLERRASALGADDVLLRNIATHKCALQQVQSPRTRIAESLCARACRCAAVRRAAARCSCRRRPRRAGSSGGAYNKRLHSDSLRARAQRNCASLHGDTAVAVGSLRAWAHRELLQAAADGAGERRRGACTLLRSACARLHWGSNAGQRCAPSHLSRRCSLRMCSLRWVTPAFCALVLLLWRGREAAV